MKLNKIGSNMFELDAPTGKVLFSYATPVAADINGVLVKTDTHYSVTTSRHINKWLDGSTAVIVNQSVIDALTV